MNAHDSEVLQAFEHVLEELRRLSEVAQYLVDAMQRGERLSDAALTSYADQLRKVDEERLRLEAMLPILWQFAARTNTH